MKIAHIPHHFQFPFNYCSKLPRSSARGKILARIGTAHFKMYSKPENGVQPEEGTALTQSPIRTEVLLITSLAKALPKWSAVDDPLLSYHEYCQRWPRAAVQSLERGAEFLSSPKPHLVAFPTETVYGLGADATRSACVRRIYWAKNRPADNPLIVHVASLQQLSSLIGNPLPTIYEPLVKKFWPGPLTIILPLPEPSPFAPEVTNSLKNFGVRMPATPLARLLIALSGKPIAAPSANTSKRPSTTTAQHVLEDLDGRVDIILDGGPCGVGVESTVVDGTCDPPAILRPGGIGIEDIRALGGEWTKIVVGYNDVKKHEDIDGVGPRAPGMKYKHYAPKGTVHLIAAGTSQSDLVHKLSHILRQESRADCLTVGLIRTSCSWKRWLGCRTTLQELVNGAVKPMQESTIFPAAQGIYGHLGNSTFRFYDMRLGPSIESVAQDIFAALRACDELNCDIIMIEGLREGLGAEANGLATAVMNRLRKATIG
jgi:L-threonylcarbamoyladenylate synthase